MRIGVLGCRSARFIMTDCVFKFRSYNGFETEFNRKIGSDLERWWKGRVYEIVVHREQIESGQYDKWLKRMKTEFAVPEGLKISYWDEIKMPKAIHTPMICHDYRPIELRQMKDRGAYCYEEELKKDRRLSVRTKKFFKRIACKIVRLFL